jgi:tetratricopeptide (TPR) repeat protein
MDKVAIVLIVAGLSAGKCFSQYKLYEAGIAKINEKDYFEAMSNFSDFLSKSQREKKFDKDAYYWRGVAAFRLNIYEEALADLQKAVELKHPNQGNTHWFMAQCNERLGKLNEALSEYGNALKLMGHDKTSVAKIHFERAQVYFRQGKSELAREDLQNATSADPSNPVYKTELARLVAGDVKTTTSPTFSVAVDAGATTAEAKSAQPPTTPHPVKAEPITTAPTLANLYADEKRFALVIGNSAYSKEIGVLKNPVNDATDFAAVLKQMNFDVTLITDATFGKIRSEVMKFRQKLTSSERDKTVGLFYYAGHGLQYDNENYIVPVDAEIADEYDIARFCWPIQKQVLGFMENTSSRMNIVILDACRNNPYPAMHRSMGGSESQGLGEMKKARGAFIAYATSPGSVASDGTGRNGLYTQELIKAMSKPGLTIEQVFKEVRANVLRQSGEKQNPWENSNIVGDFYFKLDH